MNSSLFAALAFILLAAPALAKEAPPGNIYDEAPFTTGAYFSSAPCIETFPCDEYMTAEQYMNGADHCSSTRLGYPAGMMKYFETSGTYENCALPGTFAPKSSALGAAAQWPICCVEEVQDQPGLCRFTCHSYISG